MLSLHSGVDMPICTLTVVSISTVQWYIRPAPAPIHHVVLWPNLEAVVLVISCPAVLVEVDGERIPLVDYLSNHNACALHDVQVYQVPLAALVVARQPSTLIWRTALPDKVCVDTTANLLPSSQMNYPCSWITPGRK